MFFAGGIPFPSIICLMVQEKFQDRQDNHPTKLDSPAAKMFRAFISFINTLQINLHGVFIVLVALLLSFKTDSLKRKAFK
jgi:hypothetical protein